MIRFLEATPFHSGTLGWEREAFTHTHTQKHKHRTLLHKSRCPCLQWWVTNTSVVYWSPQDLWWTVYQPNSISSHVELLGLEDWVCHFNPGPYISYFNFVEIAGYYDSPCDWIIQITFSAYCFITSDSWSLVESPKTNRCTLAKPGDSLLLLIFTYSPSNIFPSKAISW